MVGHKFKTRLFRSSLHRFNPGNPLVATLGNFDGVHFGHQQLIERAISRLQQLRAGQQGSGSQSGGSMLISFYPHPDLVLGFGSERHVLTTVRQRQKILSQLGLDYLYMLRFTKELASMSAEEFIEIELFKKLGVQHLVIGPDARVGKGGQGDAAFICRYFEQAGRSAEIVPFFQIGAQRVSSGRMRTLIRAGQVDEVLSLCGRNYRLDGRVRPGQQRGSAIGIPTANLEVHGQVLPNVGVYATKTYWADKVWKGVTNIGYRPTFAGQSLSVETHMFEYKGGPLYGQRMEVEFIKPIRAERRFDSIQDLVAQIQQDIKRAEEVLA